VRNLIPVIEVDVTAARRQLERLLGSAGFARNERLSRFLQFIVERHLEGKDEELKESVIGVEVFDRSPDYNPKKDAIVRIEAGRLRARLGEYYAEAGKLDELVIELPKGGYVPVIRPSERMPEVATPLTIAQPEPPRRRRWVGTKFWVGAGLAAIVVVALAAMNWRRFYREAQPIPIAVLPLMNLNQDPADDYFADGLTSEIIRNLSIIEGLAVRSEASTFALKSKSLTARDAGQLLEADYLLEGSVLRSGEQLRINVQLVRVSDDFPLWSEKYEREMKDIFSIQDEISRGIVNNLRLKLGRGRRKYETSTEAYDLYLRARAQDARFDRPVLRQSVPLYEQAIAKDPNFAPAYAGLAEAHAELSGNTNFDIPREVKQMHAAAEKAIELDPLSAESYDALGAAYARDGKWEQSEKSFLRALELQPQRANSHTHFASLYLLPLGRLEEAIAQLHIAERSDPLAPEVHYFLWDTLADAGRYEEAAKSCEKLPPEQSAKNRCTFETQVLLGKAREVVEFFEAKQAKPEDLVEKNLQSRTPLGCAYARLGRREEAESLAPRENGGEGGAEIFSCLGDKDRVFEILDRNSVVGPIRMGYFLLRVDRANRGLLQGDPRLTALRKKVGLPE
jgi:adenylate cyclase